MTISSSSRAIVGCARLLARGAWALTAQASPRNLVFSTTTTTTTTMMARTCSAYNSRLAVQVRAQGAAIVGSRQYGAIPGSCASEIKGLDEIPRGTSTLQGAYDALISRGFVQEDPAQVNYYSELEIVICN